MFAFSPQTTLIVGPNASGKTNILEAIMLLATAKSFRADQDREAIRWKEHRATVQCHLSNAEGVTRLELSIANGDGGEQRTPSKAYFVNGVPRRQVDFMGHLRAVLFWPEHLELVTNSPSLRRSYLDSVLVQVDREYRRNLLSYERGLRQRNRLLHMISDGRASREHLLFWNQLLVKAGGYLTQKRSELIDFYNRHSWEKGYAISYGKSVISDARLKQYADEEVAAKATLVGPHRDDFLVSMGGNNLSKYGSRGEQRLAVLWMKRAELAFITERVGERPILLLDDMFSELDSRHRQLVVELIGRQQTILTSSDPAIIGEKDFPVIRL